MKNKLEEFVQRNRDAFDTAVPGRDVWKEIEKNPLRKETRIFRLFTRMQAAAILLVIVNAAILFFLFDKKAPVTNPANGKAPVEQAMENKAPAYEEQLDQISKVVEVKQAKLKEIENSNPVLYKKFTSALSQLDDVYRGLEKELSNNPNKEQLLEAMIQNLSLQQELLNQQLSIYQKIKQNKNEKVSKNI